MDAHAPYFATHAYSVRIAIAGLPGAQLDQSVPSCNMWLTPLSILSCCCRSLEAPKCCCNRYWTLVEEKPDRWLPMQHVLPSDCSRRLDLQTLLSGDVEAAQVKKVELENLQRTDAKIRKAAGSPG